ncbi:MAG: hypothetical protein QOC65_756 [Sphingomonadales bacterium]|nr:hypothetical protein [Sphingomonadales bacterium]
MRRLAAFLNRPGRGLQRLGVCANAGLLVGMVAGGLLALLHLLHGLHEMDAGDAFRVWLLLALSGWLTLLFVFVVLARWRLAAVAGAALVNSALVTAVTVYVCWLLDLYADVILIGIVAGMTVGLLLCRLSSLLPGR